MLNVVNLVGFIFCMFSIWIDVFEKLYWGVLGVFFMKRIMGVEEMVLLIVCFVWFERKWVCIEVRKEVWVVVGVVKVGWRSCFFGRVVSIFGV